MCTQDSCNGSTLQRFMAGWLVQWSAALRSSGQGLAGSQTGQPGAWG